MSRYDTAVLADGPVAYWPMNDTGATLAAAAGPLNGTYTAGPAVTTVPNGDGARAFDGATQFAEVAASGLFSVPTTGALTVEAWMRPDILEFPHAESTGYVHWLAKGTPGQHEWAMRMYSATTTDTPPRPNRISGYAFNLAGSLGSGSYFQDAVTVGQWIHVALVISVRNIQQNYPTGYTKIFKNGVQRGQDRLDDFSVIPEFSTAPLRIGSRSTASYFQGAIGKVAIYDYEMPAVQLLKHYRSMTGASAPVHGIARTIIGGQPRVINLLAP